MEGIVTKTLFLKDKKDQLHLVAAAEQSAVDMKAFGKDARFAKDEVRARFQIAALPVCFRHPVEPSTSCGSLGYVRNTECGERFGITLLLVE